MSRLKKKVIDGEVYMRCYAYQHKKDPDLFGLLEATSYEDAKRHLGSGYRIKSGWATLEVVLSFDREVTLAAIDIVFRGRIPRPDPTIGRDDEGRPIFAVKATAPFWHPLLGRKEGETAVYGCHLVFACPRCGKENLHGGVHGKKGAGDGHRVSHCDCWPNGYYIREV